MGMPAATPNLDGVLAPTLNPVVGLVGGVPPNTYKPNLRLPNASPDPDTQKQMGKPAVSGGGGPHDAHIVRSAAVPTFPNGGGIGSGAGSVAPAGTGVPFGQVGVHEDPGVAAA